MEGDYIKLGSLEIYKLSVELSDTIWKIYSGMDWHDKKILGDQLIRATDSIGANIAEGYGRFHYLDRIRFYYNARGSLLEIKHWILLLGKRSKISKEIFQKLLKKLDELHKQLNAFIKFSRPH